ncbi:hypothetical protein BGW38_005463 [Lunasporangiospora selenospora]|uniref:Uncharacterized protein n=1 Tax=Lunasporangiospora selenospora TaxID=979761 RepID=A0A9P6FMY8_9FUNG|nr:hypothetical protein BGW38_005463 [Lunasporangiospora selenospora]
MPSGKKVILAFIASIPDGKISDMPDGTGSNPLWDSVDLRLDMQGMTSNSPKKHNLQIQINAEATHKSLKTQSKSKLNTSVAAVLAPPGSSPKKIREGFVKSLASGKIVVL